MVELNKYGLDDVDFSDLQANLLLVKDFLTQHKAHQEVLFAIDYIDSDTETLAYNERELKRKIDGQKKYATKLESEKKELEETIGELGELSRKLIENYIDMSLYEKQLLLAKLRDFSYDNKQENLGVVLDLLAI